MYVFHVVNTGSIKAYQLNQLNVSHRKSARTLQAGLDTLTLQAGL